MIEVLASGPFATLQDVGRTGYLELGVGRSGAADADAHRLANRLVGNAESAASIEVTLGGLRVRLGRAATIALTGARAVALATQAPATGSGGDGPGSGNRGVGPEPAGGPGDGRPGSGSRPAGSHARSLAWNTALSLAAGTVVTLAIPASGLRSYLAVRGGLDVPAVLDSRSTDTLSGLGPPPLRRGTWLDLGNDVSTDPRDDFVVPADHGAGRVRVIAGPRDDWFAATALQTLTSAAWTVQPTSNRIGLRLSGPGLRRLIRSELASEPTLPGAIQVPPDGQPIVLGPDAPVTGGYPVIAVVAHRDLPTLGQLRPGDPLRFVRHPMLGM